MRQPSISQSMLNDPEHSNCSREDNLVDPSIPSCTCDDFTHNGFLCVHLLESITDRNNLLWERLPSSYLFSSFLMVDEGAAGGEQILGAGENEEDECVNTVSGLSPKEEATSNLEGKSENVILNVHIIYRFLEMVLVFSCYSCFSRKCNLVVCPEEGRKTD